MQDPFEKHIREISIISSIISIFYGILLVLILVVLPIAFLMNVEDNTTSRTESSLRCKGAYSVYYEKTLVYCKPTKQAAIDSLVQEHNHVIGLRVLCNEDTSIVKLWIPDYREYKIRID